MDLMISGVYIIQGEMNQVVAAMRRGVRWTSHNHLDDDNDPLIKNFADLKEIVNHISDLSDLEPNTYLSPFLDVIRSEDTTGPVTGLALSSVNKFLSYGLIDPSNPSASASVENITDAVTHARFVGTDPSSDEVVLMKILQVLRTLVLTPVGMLLSNESVCEIMQSCFRICFEMRLSELLRKSAEHALTDMVQLLFTCLPRFTEDGKWYSNSKKLKMRASGIDNSRGKQRKRSPKPKPKKIGTSVSSNKPETLPLSGSMTQLSTLSPDSGIVSSQENTVNNNSPNDSKLSMSDEVMNNFVNIVQNDNSKTVLHGSSSQDTNQQTEENGHMMTPLSSPSEGYIDIHNSFHLANMDSLDNEAHQYNGISIGHQWDESNKPDDDKKDNKEGSNSHNSGTVEINGEQDSSKVDNEFINSQGVRFTQQQQNKEGMSGMWVPYGLPCVRELFRFLISLINPIDKHNTDIMIHIGLNLLTVSLETGADHINNFSSLLTLVKDDLCRNLFSLIYCERMTVFAAMLRVCFLLFESLRSHLKFQLEMYLVKLMDIIASESSRISYEQREMVLDALVQLWRIPGVVTELYLNYDCDLYCHNLFEDLTKLLSKNAFPVSGLYSTHLLALDALLTVIDSIEMHCHSRILNEHQNQEQPQGQVINAEKQMIEETETLPPLLVNSASSGFMLGQHLLNNDKNKIVFSRSNRIKTSIKIPSHEDIMAIKHKKKLLATGTEHFNVKPSKGIQFLQDNNILSCVLDPQEVIILLKENPRLDKKMIGEYISNRKNLKVLEAFVKSFNFEDTRIDEALRMYLEAFRLPGEAPLISLLLEHFAEHWHKANGELFVNSDAAFTLAYAIIMLNVDQHNYNVKKQNNPMTLEEFRKNLSKVNGGQDFDQDMLEEIYNAVRNEEIVMPAEHTGLVKENYLWKVLLRRGTSKDGSFIHAPNGVFDHDLFSLTWGPTVAALSFVFDKSLDEAIIHRAISGFRKCAMISAHYGMSDVFDNLVISLCKFTALLNSAESPESLPLIFGSNSKAQLAAKAVFNLAHRHGDILHDGWKNLLDCMLQLFKAKLLPKELVEAEDFVDPSGHISLIREETPSQRVDSGLFSSFYSYITLTSESQNQRGPTPEDLAAREQAQNCIHDCLPEQLITESKFLQMNSLQELVKALIFASHAPDGHISLGGTYDEDAAVFFLELLIKIVLQNRDRVNVIWPSVRDHIYSLIMGACATEHMFLMERAVVGLLHLAIRLLRREDMTAQVLQSLRMLLLMKPHTLFRVSRQISFALYELLKTNAANIHSAQDWSTLFTLLECAGAGAKPPRILNSTMDDVNRNTPDNVSGAQSDSEISSRCDVEEITHSSDRGYTSDSELLTANMKQPVTLPQESSGNHSAASGWILVRNNVGKEGEIETVQVRPMPVNQYNIIFQRELLNHDTNAFIKACESLAFLVRDVAHITPENFETCVHCLRTFVEATLNGGKSGEKRKQKENKERKSKNFRRKEDAHYKKINRSPSTNLAYQADDEDEEEDCPGTYHQMSIQLLDLMHTLHTRASSIFNSWAEDTKEKYFDHYGQSSQTELSANSIWSKCWCPLLQGIARLCCDSRRNVRTSAVTYLQRALLVHDLQTLTPLEWEACFNKVLFPLLAKLLENISPADSVGVEETRMRGATLLCKVFLQHLTPLLSLPTFTALWLTILDFMDKYMHAEKSDLLYEAIPESLKNMLLVMDTAGIFHSSEGTTRLWTITWDRIDVFLPGLKDEVFKTQQQPAESPKLSSEPVEKQDDHVISIEISGDKDIPNNDSKNQKKDSDVLGISKIAEETVSSHSPLTAEAFSASNSIILQPPLPSAAVARPTEAVGINIVTPIVTPVSPNGTVISSSNVPLIINPNIMEGAGISLSPPHMAPPLELSTPTSVSQY